MARALTVLAPESLRYEIIKIVGLLIYNQDFDGFLFVTLEYTRSIPDVLNGKPGAVMTVSPGAIGGFGANYHLRQSLLFLNVPTMQQPQAYIANAVNLFDGSGNLSNDSTREFTAKYLHAFDVWVETNTSGGKQ